MITDREHGGENMSDLLTEGTDEMSDRREVWRCIVTRGYERHVLSAGALDPATRRFSANIGFEAFCDLLRRLWFEARTRSSHRLLRRAGVEELGERRLRTAALRGHILSSHGERH